MAQHSLDSGALGVPLVAEEDPTILLSAVLPVVLLLVVVVLVRMKKKFSLSLLQMSKERAGTRVFGSFILV